MAVVCVGKADDTILTETVAYHLQHKEVESHERVRLWSLLPSFGYCGWHMLAGWLPSAGCKPHVGVGANGDW